LSASADSAAAGTSGREARYRSYLLAVLLALFAFNTIDRLALGLLLENIKADLGLTDTQLGVLTGIAFALFYAVLGVPIARWADRGNRVTILSLGTALLAAALALTGAATTFLQLLAIRVCAAVGEAGCIPPSHSLIADYYTRAERPRAVAVYMLGGPLSVVIGLFLAGWLNEFYGWRVTFLLLGIPGLALAVLAKLTLRDPRFAAPASGISPGLAPPSTSPPRLATVIVTLWTNTTFRHLVIFNAVVSFFGFGIVLWQPIFFVRSFGLQTGELGTWLAVINGTAGVLGTYWGGAWASRRAAHNEALQLKVVAGGYCSFGVIAAAMYFSPNQYVAFGLYALATTGTCIAIGPLYATMQTLIPERMRAMAFAVMYFFGNLIGMGLGPLLAGVLSDAFRSWAGEESIRYALLTLTPGYVWAAWHLWRASKTVAHDLRIRGA
jgi:MFS transporter, Spinster family, sphingosine-1-phosphate transporter